MPSDEIKAAPFVADPDRAFLDSLKQAARSQANQPILVSSESEALAQISQSDRPVSGIFINPKLSPPQSLRAIKAVLQYRPATPLFILTDGADNPFSSEDIKGLAIISVLQKPLSYEKIEQTIQDATKRMDDEKAAEESSDQIEASGVDANFAPILAANFVAGSVSSFDVYVRLGSNKFLKILRAKDSFPPERLDSYRRKGVLNFFIRKETQESYLKYCDNMATIILKNAKISDGAKISMTLNHGQETVNFLKNHGVKPTLVAHAQKFATNIQDILPQLKVNKNDACRDFMADLASYEHGVATTVISGLMLKPLRFETLKSTHAVGLASLLHDVGLQDMDPKFKKEDESNLSDEEIRIYHTHPKVGAKILASIPRMDPAVIQAVEQHHERRTRTGFPDRIGAGQLNQMAEIIAIADEFAGLLEKSKTDRSLIPLMVMRDRVFHGFSLAVIEAFTAVFPD